MGHIPLLKDGVVINVIELDDDCACVTKAVHKEMSASEEADYRKRLNAWRQRGQAHHEEIAAAKRKAFMALGIANALKVQTRGESRGNGNTDPFLRPILVADKDAEAWRNKVAELQAKPLPPKPKMIRTKRWFHPDDVIVGPSGGNIGDRWDGKRYIMLEEQSADK